MRSHIKFICTECQGLVDAELQCEDVKTASRYPVEVFTWHVSPCPFCIAAGVQDAQHEARAGDKR